MKRSELIQILKSKLKSFKYTDFDAIKFILLTDEEDKLIGDSMLISTTEKHPWKIPVNYGLGIETEYDGQKYISTKYKDDTNFKMCSISITDYRFCGNNHSYGEVSVENVKWMNKENRRNLISSELSRQYTQATSTIKWNVCRMLFEDDIKNGKGDWSDYEPYCPTERFDSYDELLLTSIYTIIARVEGPLKIKNKSSCIVVSDDDMLITIDNEDNVKLRNDIAKLIDKF